MPQAWMNSTTCRSDGRRAAAVPSAPPPLPSWREAVAKAGAWLDAAGVPDPHVCAELLAARLLACGRGELPSRAEILVAEKHLAALRRALKRLRDGEPLQYVLGEWDFRHLTLSCDPRALIPRPETEGLVQLALDWMSANPPKGRRMVVDAGTGTGAIILSLARESREDAVFLGIDISQDALDLATANAKRNGLDGRVRFALADGLDDFDEPESIDLIVSNPPYVASAECDTLDPRVRLHEPRLALDGGPDGLDFHKRYLADALNLLKPGGAVFFEIGETQGEAVAALMRDCGFSQIQIRKDLAGRDRYASATI